MSDIDRGDYTHVSQFQNRRNRTKKPNETGRKKPICKGAILPLDSLRERMGKYTVRNEQPSGLPLEASRSSRFNEPNLTQGVRDSL